MHVITAHVWIVRNAEGNREGFLRYLPEGYYADEQVVKLDLAQGRKLIRAAKSYLSEIGYQVTSEAFSKASSLHHLTAVKQ